jgi:hypothetical protein
MVLALCGLVPDDAAGQSQGRDQGQVNGAVLGQNYPNPFSRETTIPFTVGGGAACTDPGRQYRVSLRIFNVLAQPIAVPVMHGGTSGAGVGQAARNVTLTCGSYLAFWDGTITTSGRDAAAGMYLYQLEVDGRPTVRRMLKVP